jgi:outer membrane immunogenic protein
MLAATHWGKVMKSSLLVSFGLVPLFASPIMAADLPVKAPALKAAPLYNWTGCYAGAHFGSLFAQKDWGALGSHDDTGLLVGGQLGCNYQVSTWVFGVQGDIAWSDTSGSHGDQVNGVDANLNPLFNDQSKINSLSSVTGRVGYAWDRLLTYAKAGGAWTHDKYDILTNDSANATASTASETRSGWTVGGGFEYGITNNLTMFFEYDFYDFGTRTIGFTGSSQLVDIRERASAVKVGGNWKFNW